MDLTSTEREAALRLDTMLTKLRELETSFGQDITRFLWDPSTDWYEKLC